MDISEASIYVGTYHKYNSGSIFGKWMKMDRYSDREEFFAACAKLHGDEADPEYMFQDYENIPERLISESWLSDSFFEVRDAICEMEEKRVEAFFIWLHNNSIAIDDDYISLLIQRFDEDYQGEFTREEFGRHIIELSCYLDDFVLRYFDYESYANDLLISDYWIHGTHVFRNR